MLGRSDATSQTAKEMKERRAARRHEETAVTLVVDSQATRLRRSTGSQARDYKTSYKEGSTKGYSSSSTAGAAGAAATGSSTGIGSLGATTTGDGDLLGFLFDCRSLRPPCPSSSLSENSSSRCIRLSRVVSVSSSLGGNGREQALTHEVYDRLDRRGPHPSHRRHRHPPSSVWLCAFSSFLQRTSSKRLDAPDCCTLGAKPVCLKFSKT